jgi:hypothetical protein
MMVLSKMSICSYWSSKWKSTDFGYLVYIFSKLNGRNLPLRWSNNLSMKSSQLWFQIPHYNNFFSFLETGLAVYPRQASNLRFSSLSPPGAAMPAILGLLGCGRRTGFKASLDYIVTCFKNKTKNK